MSTFKTKKLITKAQTTSSPVGEISQEAVIKPPSRPYGKYILLAFLFLFASVFAGTVYLGAFQSNIKNGSEAFHQTNPASIIEDFVETKKVEGTTNILIAGIGGKGHEGADLTDSIMLASLDAATGRVTLLSIPRDLYISYPEGKGAGRINSLYDVGRANKVGIKYLADKVTEITGQPIDHYMVIDFSGFKQIIDILGGVEVDVPDDLLDREYPDENYGYQVFSVKKGLQKFDGETALKYSRSRHSTSDFDRSNRQQLIIKAIKEKASALGYITNPAKIGELYNAVISHLDTDLSVAKMGEIAFSFRDIKTENISIVSLTNECPSLTKCVPGSYLYSPSRDLFGGAAVIVPENAQAAHLSYYKDIRKFVDLLFHFPTLPKESRDIVFVSDPTVKKRTQEIAEGLAKMGFPMSPGKTIIYSTGSIEKSHINIYWHADLSVGIDPEGTIVSALKYIEESIPYVIVGRNEYVNTAGPKIEIVIGKDANTMFSFIKYPQYLPLTTKGIVSGEKNGSGKVSSPLSSGSTSIQSTASGKVKKINKTIISGESKNTKTQNIQVGEWENF